MSTARILIVALGGTALGLVVMLLARASATEGPPTVAIFAGLAVALAALILGVVLYARGRYGERG